MKIVDYYPMWGDDSPLWIRCYEWLYHTWQAVAFGRVLCRRGKSLPLTIANVRYQSRRDKRVK